VAPVDSSIDVGAVLRRSTVDRIVGLGAWTECRRRWRHRPGRRRHRSKAATWPTSYIPTS